MGLGYSWGYSWLQGACQGRCADNCRHNLIFAPFWGVFKHQINHRGHCPQCRGNQAQDHP